MQGASAAALAAAEETAKRAWIPDLIRTPELAFLQDYWVTPLKAKVQFARWDQIMATPVPPEDLAGYRAVRDAVSIPVAVKIGPYFSAIGAMALGLGAGALKVREPGAPVLHAHGLPAPQQLRRLLEGDDVVPVAVVLGQIAEPVVRVEQQVLAPRPRPAARADGAALEQQLDVVPVVEGLLDLGGGGRVPLAHVVHGGI